MATILCIETATKNCSVALSVNGSVIALQEDATAGYSHAEKLHDFIEDVIQKSTLSKNDIDAIAVSKGPGSYTGLRIGVSAAKGLCYALNVPLISIPTLTVLAYQVQDTSTAIPMLDARRMEVYSAIFDATKNQIRDTKAEIVNNDSFASNISEGKTTFIGDGVEKFMPLIEHTANTIFITNALPSANEMATIAEKKFKEKQFEDVAYFEPYYLKDFKVG